MKMLLPRIVLTAIVGCFVARPAPAAESLSVLLQKGIYAEETEGNLDSAIKIYEQIAAEGATNRALIAQAQYRLAVCYQKQGKKEQAVGIFSDLLRQFPSDAALVKKAREQLAALGYSAPETVTLRKIATVNTTWFRAASPTGRFIAYTGDNGEIFMQEPATGKAWQLLKCNWENSPWGFAFSPDDRRVAYDMGGTTLFVSNADGSDAKEIYKPKGKDTIWPIRWLAPNGKIVAELSEGERKTKSIVSIDPKSGELKRFNIPPVTGRGKIVSSDGRYLSIQDNNKLVVVDLESGKRETLVEDHVTNIHGWARGDSELFFSSDRTGLKSLWVIPAKAGKAAGEPTLVKESSEEIDFVDVTPDGRVYYTENNYAANVCVVSANLETGEITDEPRLLTDRFPGTQTMPSWSKDGQKLWVAIQGDQRRFVAVSISSGKQEDLPLAPNFKNWIQSYALSNAGTFLILEGARTNKPGSTASTWGIHRYEPATGKVDTLLAQKRGDSPHGPQISPDGKSLYFLRDVRDFAEKDNRKNRKTVITRRDFASGKDEVVSEFAGDRVALWPYEIALSPDGSRLALTTSDELWNENFVATIDLIDVRTGKKVEFLRGPGRERITSLGWTPDGKRLVYSRSTVAPSGTEPVQSGIWSAAVDSGRSVKLNLAFPGMGRDGIGDVAVNPDGHRVAFRIGAAGDTGQLWVMEGASPAQPAKSEPGAQRKVIGQNSNGTIALDRLIQPNNSIFDRSTGLRAALPAGWELAAAARANDVLFIDFKVPDGEKVFARIALSFDEPMNLAGKEIEAWLKKWAETTHLEHRAKQPFTAYKNRADSFVARTVGGLPALRWEGEFKADGENCTEHATLIYWEQGSCLVWLAAPSARAADLSLAYESLVETVRLPSELTRSDLSLKDISGPDNSIFDPESGVRATIPAGLKFQNAVRKYKALFVNIAPAPSGGAEGRLSFQYGNPVSIPAKEVDAWLRQWAEMHRVGIASMAKDEEYAYRPGSFVSRTIGGRPALSWTGDFTRGFEKWTEYLTLIYHPDGLGFIHLRGPAKTNDELRPAYEQLVESVRLP